MTDAINILMVSTYSYYIISLVAVTRTFVKNTDDMSTLYNRCKVWIKMNFKLTRPDVDCLKTMYRLGRWLGITPSYDFDHSCVLHPSRDKLRAVLVSTIIFLAFMYVVYKRVGFYLDHSLPGTFIIMDSINEGFAVITCISAVLCISFWKQLKWTQFNNNLQFIDKNLADETKTDPWFPSFAYVQLVLVNTVFIILVNYMNYVWVKRLGFWLVYRGYLLHEVCSYYDLYVLFLMYNGSLAVKRRCRKLNELLKCQCPSGVFKIVPHNLTSGSIRSIGRLFRVLNESVTLYSNVFGYPFVFMTAKRVAQIVLSLNVSLLDLDLINPGLTKRYFIPNFMYSMLILSSWVVIVMECDSANNEGKTTIQLCYKLEEQFLDKSEERSELILLAKKLVSSPLKFTATEFFEINRTMVFSIIGLSTTYFIVVLQFNDGKDDITIN